MFPYLRGLLENAWQWRTSRQGTQAISNWQTQHPQAKLRFEAMTAAALARKGIRLKACEWTGDVRFVRDVKTYQIAAFVGVILSLESDETDETAVQVLTREASAVFYYQAGRWEPTDKTLFNMEPKEATTRFDKQFKELSKTNEA